MIRVGIMSMQRIANYGSFLQAYALKKILEELGCKVEFVDYHAGKCLGEIDEKGGIERKLKKLREVLKCRASISDKLKYIDYKRNYAKRFYPLLGIEKKTRNYAPELELLIIGSDEVFNCTQKNVNVGYSRELFGYGNHAKKAITYAASFGNTTMEKVKRYGIADILSKDLKRLEAISIRDTNSWEVVENLTGMKPVIHLDPVLIYPWENLIPKEPPIKEKYMVLYGYSGRFSEEECRRIRMFAKQKKLRIISIGGIQDVRNTFVNCSPLEVLRYFASAACVITDTFHGVIFSVITHRQFGVYVRSGEYGNEEKVNDLLHKLCLENRRISESDDIENLLEQKIMFQETDKIIRMERKHTQEYLKGQIG